MDLAAVEKEIRQLLEDANFMSYYGFRLHSLGEGECTITIPYQSIFPGGVVNGPVFMAAADGTMWFAIRTRLEREEAHHTVTADMQSNFLAGGRHGPFSCTARILKLGRRLIYGVAECKDSQGKLVTHHTLTFSRPER